MRALRFKMDWQKAIEAVQFLATIHPGITPYYIAKVFYYADKEHLSDWGRSICGDLYVAMENGPVPSNIYSLVKRDPFLEDDIIADFDRIIKREDRHIYAIIPHKQKVLSGSDMDYLASAEGKYSRMHFLTLRDLVHRERAWREAWESRVGLMNPIDMTAMIDDEIPDRELVLQEIADKAACSDASSNSVARGDGMVS